MKKSELIRTIQDLAEVAFRSHGKEGKPVLAAVLAVHRAWVAAQAIVKAS